MTGLLTPESGEALWTAPYARTLTRPVRRGGRGEHAGIRRKAAGKRRFLKQKAPRRKPPEHAGNRRKPPEHAGNRRNTPERPPRGAPEHAGTRRKHQNLKQIFADSAPRPRPFGISDSGGLRTARRPRQPSRRLGLRPCAASSPANPQVRPSPRRKAKLRPRLRQPTSAGWRRSTFW